MEKLTMHSPDLTMRNIDKLANLFPAVITESLDDEGNVVRSVDFDLLRQELSDHVVDGPQERYQLDWPGKREALFAANAPIAKTLRPMREESVDFDTTKNLFIEGDNLEALKLLQESYLGKVKLIYIDPPYNTGGDFIYDDNYGQSADEYLARSGQVDDGGSRLVANTEANGRLHSNWLTMIYPRLTLARNLLKDDGVIFVSIDDNEAANLKALMNEVFGAENFISTIVWQKVYSPMNSATQFASVHDYIHVYARNAKGWTSNLLPRSEEQDRAYQNPDHDPRGRWKAVDATAAAGHATPTQFYELVTPAGNTFTPPPGRAWLYTRPRYEEMLADNRVWFGKDGAGRPAIKRFLTEVKQGRFAQTFWSYDEVGHNQDAKKELLARVAFGPSERVFDTPKPTKLIRRMLAIATRPDSDDVVMDFFAGSGTTADAVLQHNAEDGGHRRFILVQVGEEPNSSSGIASARQRTIADIARERIRRTGEVLIERGGLIGGEFDVGFRSLRVGSTNMADSYRTPDSLPQGQLGLYTDSIKPDRMGEDLLFQVLLDWGLEPTMPITVENIHGNEVFIVENGALIACFDTGVSPTLVRSIANREPLRAVFRDAGFATDADRINAEQVFAEVSPATDVKAI